VTLAFDFNSVQATEFGVGRDVDGDQAFELIPIDDQVQRALQEMGQATWDAMRKLADSPAVYEPTEKYASAECLILPLGNDLSGPLGRVHQANNLPVNAAALSDTSGMFCYFARMIDHRRRHLTAIRRATQFKGVLKRRLIRLTTDTLRLIPDAVFKLDADFDLLIDGAEIKILRPSGFESLGGLKEALLAAVPKNVRALQSDLGFVDFSPIQDYASSHPRAARYLSSIRSQKETKNVDKRALKRFCKELGINTTEANGKIFVQPDQIMDFLEVLDRRRYRVQLIKGSPERFKATSRQKLGNQD
jgi:hypothetical protein